MRINTVPVDAYRQASNQSIKSGEAAPQEAGAGQPQSIEKITLPGSNPAEAGSVRVSQSPSALNGVLSSEEKTMLVKHFARFGDSQESQQIYGTDARVRAGALTGTRLDVKG